MAIRCHVRLKEAAAISPPVRSKHSLEWVQFQQLRCDSSPDDKWGGGSITPESVRVGLWRSR